MFDDGRHFRRQAGCDVIGMTSRQQQLRRRVQRCREALPHTLDEAGLRIQNAGHDGLVGRIGKVRRRPIGEWQARRAAGEALEHQAHAGRDAAADEPRGAGLRPNAIHGRGRACVHDDERPPRHAFTGSQQRMPAVGAELVRIEVAAGQGDGAGERLLRAQPLDGRRPSPRTAASIACMTAGPATEHPTARRRGAQPCHAAVNSAATSARRGAGRAHSPRSGHPPPAWPI